MSAVRTALRIFAWAFCCFVRKEVMQNANHCVLPGDVAPVDGCYTVRNSMGWPTSSSVQMKKGEVFPDLPEPGSTYELGN